MTTALLPPAAPAVLDAARALAPAIAARAGEIEANRRLPADLRRALAEAGFFRMLLPETYGGLALGLPDALHVYEELARADGSTGWIVALNASSWHDVVGVPRATFDALLGSGPGVVFAGAFAPAGSTVAEPGGYRVNGRWAYVSGCEDADWLFGNTIEATPGGPVMRMVVLAPDEVRIEDTWHVVGLAGTGSHHVSAQAVLVPPDRTFPLMACEPCVDVPIVRVPAPSMFALEIASVALGIAQGALDDVVALAAAKVPMLARAPLAEHPLFQLHLATADTELRAARALLHDAAGALWERAVAGEPYPDALRARVRAAATWATERAAAVVGTAYRAGGGGAVFASSPLQRRLRDVHAVTQHFLVQPGALLTAGAVLAGQDADLTLF